MASDIFISYSWKQTELVDKLEKALAPSGLIIKRDVRDIGFKGSIKEFMKQVRSTDFVIVMVSTNFLKSSNCMFEILELMKDENFIDRIIPIIVDDTHIFTAADKIAHVKYWNDEHSRLTELLRDVNSTDSIPMIQELKHIENIRGTIAQFLDSITAINCPKFTTLENNNFTDLFKYLNIEIDDKELITAIIDAAKIDDDQDYEIKIEELDQKYPNNSKIYFSKAYRAFKDGKIKASIHLYKRSIEIDPSFSPSYFNLGFNYDKYEGNPEEAKKYYLKAIELDPRDNRSITNLAKIYAENDNDHKAAKECFIKAVNINPFDDDAYFNLAVTCHDLKDFESAYDYYNKALSINSDHISARFNLGMLLYYDLSKYYEAKQQFELVLELEPLHKGALKNLGKLLEFEYEHFTTAKLNYDKFIKVEPNSADDHYFYATFLILRFPQEYKAALEHYEKACAMNPDLRTNHAEVMFKQS